MIIIKTLHFDDYSQLVSLASDIYEDARDIDEYNSINIIAKYYDMKQIIRELIYNDYDIRYIIDFDNTDNYKDEYLLSLSDNEICVERAKVNGKYLYPETYVCFIMDDCNSKIIPLIEAEMTYEVSVGDECDDDCENCSANETELSSDATASCKVNDKSVDKETYEKAIEDIEEKYLDDIRDMLLRYCEIQDEMNEWRKLLY